MSESQNETNSNTNEAPAADAGAVGAGAAQGGSDEVTVLGGAAEAGPAAGPGEGEASAAAEGEGGAGGDEAAAAGPPEKYELSVPDGFEAIDTDVMSEAEPILRELKLTNEQADKLTPIAAGLVKKTMERAEKAITDRAIAQRKEWADAFQSDPDIGGANKDRTLGDAARAFDHYGLKKGEGLRQLLDESGLGNHPDVIRFVARVGRDLDEGSFERGSAAATPKAPEQKMYGAEFQPKT